QIERAAGDGAFAPLATVGPRLSRYADATAGFGTGYRYRVRAVVGGVAGAWSDEVSAAVVAPDLTVPVDTLPPLPSPADLPFENMTRVYDAGAGVGYFTATHVHAHPFDVRRAQLWATDGTLDGTRLVAGWDQGYPEAVGTAGGAFYFTIAAPDRSVTLWVSDGTTDGTRPLRQLYTLDAGSNVNPRVYAGREADGKLRFSVAAAWDGPWTGYESDGTVDGTVTTTTDVVVRPPAADPTRVTVAGRTVYWEHGSGHYEDGIGWVFDAVLMSDGTDAAPVMLKGFGYHGTAWETTSIIAIGDDVYFSIRNDTHGRYEIWRSGLTPGTAERVYSTHGFQPRLGSVNGLLTFSNGRQWSSDGTQSGTRPLVQAFGTDATYVSHPDELTRAGDKVYFTSALGPLESYPQLQTYGRELWVTDGTADGTRRVYSGLVRNLTTIGDTLYFFAFESTVEPELWRTDGTWEGTFRVASDGMFCPSPGTGGQGPQVFGVIDDVMVFGLHTTEYKPAYELWRSDGTAAGTYRIPGPYAYVGTGEPASKHVVLSGGRVYFRAIDIENQYGSPLNELWSTDGTAAGT
ncbi:MAG TPA: hypothetical protein VF796_07820, partial [Humisphaera sp.]